MLKVMRRSILPALVLASIVVAQTKPKDVREMAKEGPSAIPKLAPFLKSEDVEIRLEAVKAITEVGGTASIDPLLAALRDNDSQVQTRAADGLVNYYLPGYVESGLTASLKRVGKSITSRFGEGNDPIIEPYVQVRADVIEELGKVARGGTSMESRATAAKAVGVLRGRAATNDLLEALKSKDSSVMFEALIAIQKIQDRSTAPRIRYLLNDFDERVQIAAIETTGLLRAEDSAADLVNVLNRTTKSKVKLAALVALGRIPDPNSRSLFQQNLTHKDEDMREAAAEGLGRLRNPEDIPALDSAYKTEKKGSARLAAAFALVKQGKREVSEFSPMQLLINSLNSSARQGEAEGYLVELAREAEVRAVLHPALATGTKDEKIRIARILGRSGDSASVQPLDKLMDDKDPEVAQEAIRASKNLKARL
jgi:HEAT repeat protein